MLIAEAIQKAKLLQDTEIPDKELVRMLSDHDGIVWEEVITNYEGPLPARPAYNEETDPEATELLIPAPWDNLYPHYLAMKIDMAHHDIDRYNNEAAAYGALRQAWADNYNRTHRWASTRQYREPRPRYYDTQILF